MAIKDYVGLGGLGQNVALTCARWGVGPCFHKVAPIVEFVDDLVVWLLNDFVGW